MRLLIMNDDGIDAPGIHSLTRAVSRWITEAPAGEERSAIVVAPHINNSGMSSAVGDVFEKSSLHYERHVIEGAENVPTFSLDASPALCTIIGALGSFGYRPNVVLSGINAGANVGRSVLHSGTIGAILTGAQLGLSGLAVSINWGDDVHFDTAADVAIEVLKEMATAPDRTLLNLNVPNLTPSELRGVRRGRISSAGIVKSAGTGTSLADFGESGDLPLRLGAATPTLGDVSDEAPEDDGALIAAGYASLTPLRGVHEDSDQSMDEIVRQSLAAIATHLAAHQG